MENIDDIKNDIEFLLNTLQDDENTTGSCGTTGYKEIIFKVNKENEIKSKLFKEKAIELYNAKDYLESLVTFGRGILDGISNKSISIIRLNESTCESEFRADLVNISPIGENAVFDYRIMVDSKKSSILSAKHRPIWYKPYYRLGKILNRLSEYEMAIQILDTATMLVNQDKSLSAQSLLSIKKSIKECKDQSIIKLAIIKKCKTVDGFRNFDSESKEWVKQYGNMVTTKFKQLKLTDQFLKKQGLSTGKLLGNWFGGLSVSSGLPKKHFLEMQIVGEAQMLYSNSSSSDDLKVTDYLSRCVGNETKLIEAYYHLAEMISFKRGGIEYDEHLIMSLYLHASLLPPVQGFENQGDLYRSIAQSKLGFIYRFGIFGQDIDLEKSIYYFKQSIENNNLIGDANNNAKFNKFGMIGKSFTILGSMYWYGITTTGNRDIELAKKYWTMGSDSNEEYCTKLLVEHFKFQSPNDNLKESIKHFKSDKEFFDYLSSQYHKFLIEDTSYFNEVLYFNDIKEQISKSQEESPSFMSTVYSTHLKVLSFKKSFNQYQLGGPISNESKFKIIEELAEAYRNFDTFFVVRIPDTMFASVLQFIQHLLEIDESNVNARICWLGLSRFSEINYQTIFDFVDRSFELTGGLDENGEIDFIFDQYKQLYSQYSNTTTNDYLSEAYSILLNSFDFLESGKDIKLGKCKHILLLSYKSIAYFGFPNNINEIIDINKLIECLVFGSLVLCPSLPNDHPYITEINFYLVLILIRLGITFKHRNEIQEFNLIVPITEFFKSGDDSRHFISQMFDKRIDSIMDLGMSVVMSLNLIKNIN